MPYKHPVLGVQCLTLFDMMEITAAENGSTIADKMEGFFGEMAAAERSDADTLLFEMRRDPAKLLFELFEWFDGAGDADPLRPFLILEVQHVTVSYSFTVSRTTVLGLAQFNDNQPRRFKLVRSEAASTWMDPGGEETDVEVWPEEVRHALLLDF